MAKPWHNGEHQRVRAQVAAEMDEATVCVLCHELRCPRTGLVLAMAWDLAHDDERPDVWLGPAHPYCNRKDWARSPRSARGVATRVVQGSTIARGLGRSRRVRLALDQSDD